MVFKLFLFDRSLVHQFVGKLDFGEVVVFSGALIKELNGFFRLFFFFMNDSQVEVSFWVSVFLGLKEVAKGAFGVFDLDRL